MEIFTVEEFQENWDDLIERVEKGERFGIVNEDGRSAVIMSTDDPLYKLYTEHHLFHIMTTLVFDQEFRIARDTSDINEHMEVLKGLADEVDHVTEMGTRTGVHTRAFLASDVIVRAYDLFLDGRVQELFKIAQQEGKDAEYIQSNVLDVEIDETDMLFIDTWHCYDRFGCRVDPARS